MTSLEDQPSKERMPFTSLNSMTTESASSEVLKVIDHMYSMNLLPTDEMGHFTMTMGWLFGRIGALEETLEDIVHSSKTEVVTQVEEVVEPPKFLGDRKA